jgi:CheY-specific phosphatase CheX
MKPDEDQDWFRGSLSASVAEFFRDYGIEDANVDEARMSRLPPPSSEHELGSVVGIRGEQLRGGLAFVAPAALVARTLPVPRDAARAERQLRDWSGEIANQLVGRLKNKLAARALDFEVGTAACFGGMSIRVVPRPSPNDESVACACVVASAGVRIYLDCSYVSVAPAPDASAVPFPAVAEGDVVLF